jgi:hypothetical protein
LRITTLNLQGGRLSGVVTNQGRDTIPGANFVENTLTPQLGARYGSVVYPLASHKWVLAGYRHELARVHQRLDSQGVFQHDPTESSSRRERPYAVERDVAITGYGVSGAYKLRQNVSVGAGLTVYSFSLDSVFTQYDRDGLYDAPNYDVGFAALTQQGRATSVAPTLGLTIDRGRTRLGVVYRQGASFAFSTQDGNDPPRDGRFRVPHTLALGMSVRPAPQLLISAEVTRITYSRLVDDFVAEQARVTGQQASFGIDDGTEFHLGAQYALGRQGGAPLRLRAGTWYDPDHSVHFRALRTPTSATDRLFDERFAVALSRGESRPHLSGGVGLTLSRRLELNGGVDVGTRSRQWSLSAIVHVGQAVQ